MRFFNIKGAILAFEIAFIICFFSGIFWNGGGLARQEGVFNQNSWYYINRGVPWPWAGVSVIDKSVNFPIIKAPLIKKDLNGNNYNKIIDLSVFLPLFIILFLISYCFTYIFGKASSENKGMNILLVPILFMFFFFGILIYFFWFPRL